MCFPLFISGCKASSDVPDPCMIETEGTHYGHTKEDVIKILEKKGYTFEALEGISIEDRIGLPFSKEDAQRKYKFTFTEKGPTRNFKRVTFQSIKTMKPGQEVEKPIPEKFFWKFYPHASEVNELIDAYCEKAKSVEGGRCDVDERNVKIAYEERIEDGETIWGCGIDVQASNRNLQKNVTIGRTK